MRVKALPAAVSKGREAEEPEDFSAPARAWAEEKGLILGDAQRKRQYRAFCTREQLVTVLYRLVGTR